MYVYPCLWYLFFHDVLVQIRTERDELLPVAAATAVENPCTLIAEVSFVRTILHL